MPVLGHVQLLLGMQIINPSHCAQCVDDSIAVPTVDQDLDSGLDEVWVEIVAPFLVEGVLEQWVACTGLPRALVATNVECVTCGLVLVPVIPVAFPIHTAATLISA
jgi:hypothetical protein